MMVIGIQLTKDAIEFAKFEGTPQARSVRNLSELLVLNNEASKIQLVDGVEPIHWATAVL